MGFGDTFCIVFHIVLVVPLSVFCVMVVFIVASCGLLSICTIVVGLKIIVLIGSFVVGRVIIGVVDGVFIIMDDGFS